MLKVITTTPKGVEGHGISFSDEGKLAEELNKYLPSGWKILFSWSQILMSDVQYKYDVQKKTIDIVYNQNLRYWSKELAEEIRAKLIGEKVIK